jgi:hypothetical protein
MEWSCPRIVFHQQMNMIRGDRIVQDLQGEPLAGFKQPCNKTSAVMSELQQKFFLLAAVSNVPDEL